MFRLQLGVRQRHKIFQGRFFQQDQEQAEEDSGLRQSSRVVEALCVVELSSFDSQLYDVSEGRMYRRHEHPVRMVVHDIMDSELLGVVLPKKF